MVNGFQMYLDEHGGMLGGARVSFIVEDDQGKPDVDVAKAKKLILQDKIDMLVGAVLASSAYALAPVSTAEKMLYIGTVSTADDLAQRQVKQFLSRARRVGAFQPNHPLGQWACDQGYKRIVTITPDYAFGYEQVGGFQKDRGLRRQDRPKDIGRSAPRISGHTFQPSRAMPTPCSR